MAPNLSSPFKKGKNLDSKEDRIMKKTTLWIVNLIVIGFLGYMIGYSVPPFLEVGFGENIELLEEGQPLPDDLLKQYEHLYNDEDEE
jgi:hypothetical protein